MLKIERLLVGRCALDYLPNKRSVVGMDPVENHFDRGPARRVVLEYSVALLRPDDFSARDVPAETTRMAKPLRFRQIGLALPQRVFGPLSILDVEADSIPSDDISFFVAQWHATCHMPAILAVRAPKALFQLERLSCRHAVAPLALG